MWSSGQTGTRSWSRTLRPGPFHPHPRCLFAVLGGLLAGAFGGWRASRLSPAEALRSVA